MSTDTPSHPLDQAMALQRLDTHLLRGRTHPAYANRVGPFGGITAATLLQAALTHPARLGDPVALTVNYAGAVADGEFDIEARPLRTNRSTQHWSIVQMQGGEVVSSATAVFALRRPTWTNTEVGFPQVPPMETLPRLKPGSVSAWTANYDMRFVKGGLVDPGTPDAGRDSVSLLWIRDDPPRPLDFAALASICDAFFPRILIRRPRWVPFGTVSISSYFHADTAHLAAVGDRPLVASARASHFGRGFHDQSAEIWSESGALLATSHQIVYFKE